MENLSDKQIGQLLLASWEVVDFREWSQGWCILGSWMSLVDGRTFRPHVLDGLSQALAYKIAGDHNAYVCKPALEWSKKVTMEGHP